MHRLTMLETTIKLETEHCIARVRKREHDGSSSGEVELEMPATLTITMLRSLIAKAADVELSIVKGIFAAAVDNSGRWHIGASLMRIGVDQTVLKKALDGPNVLLLWWNGEKSPPSSPVQVDRTNGT